MPLTTAQILIIILVITVSTQLTRWLPFILFPENKTPPRIIIYLGKVLPAAMIGLLLVYSLKNVSFYSVSHWLPEMIAILFIIVLHKIKHNLLLSIAGGTIIYMVLVQMVFIG